ncbi:MAG TPA: hypothetical protein VNH13_09425, partial [Candidatus Acidoferrales bacterium]|nr:hypothetical protein [Candidatus Acidoferrales bacterium]
AGTPGAASASGLRPSPLPPVSPALAGETLAPSDGLDELPRASAGHLTEEEFRRAEAIQDELAAQERAAMAATIRQRTRARAGDAYVEDVNAPLKVRAAHEYAYVARDVRRILITGGIMAAILAVLAILINGFGIISI